MDWVYIAVMILLIGGFVLGTVWMSFQYGVSVGKQMVQSTARPMRVSSQSNSGAQPVAPQRCPECQTLGAHHPDCPRNVKAPVASRRRGFSASKRIIESQETA